MYTGRVVFFSSSLPFYGSDTGDVKALIDQLSGNGKKTKTNRSKNLGIPIIQFRAKPRMVDFLLNTVWWTIE